jgi:hypothetical protein
MKASISFKAKADFNDQGRFPSVDRRFASHRGRLITRPGFCVSSGALSSA